MLRNFLLELVLGILIIAKPLVLLPNMQAASDVYAPVSGEVVEVNESLTDEPGMVSNEGDTLQINARASC